MTNAPLHPETICAHAGGAVDDATGGVVPAIQLSTTYRRGADNALIDPRNMYARYDTPNLRDAETALAQLEGGEEALLFSSGMAAAIAVFRRLPVGVHVVATWRGYFTLIAWLRTQQERGVLDVTFVDPASSGALGEAMRPGETALVWVETPINPVYDIVDLAAAAEVAHRAGAVLAVDSTAASPILTRPIEHGADIVFHSATKYLNGHSDVLAGALVAADETSLLWQDVRMERTQAGATLGSFEAWLLLRGMRTLHLRVSASSRNALEIAKLLQKHDAVAAIVYPGLLGGPQYDIACRQMTGGFGGMMSLVLKGGADAALRAISRLRLIKVATSLGGVESLIEHRKSVEGPQSDVDPGLLRLSVGCEHVDDIWADLAQALAD